MSTIIQHEWSGQAISFRRDDGWGNATEMARPFKKRPLHFLQLPSTKAFIAALEEDLGLMTENPSFKDRVVETARGKMGGTWMHPDLALEFARWLDPRFALWCNRQVRAILAGGTDILAPALTRALTALESAIRDLPRMVDERIEAALNARHGGPPATASPPPQLKTGDLGIRDLDGAAVALALGMSRSDLYAWCQVHGFLTIGQQPTDEAKDQGWIRSGPCAGKNKGFKPIFTKAGQLELHNRMSQDGLIKIVTSP